MCTGCLQQVNILYVFFINHWWCLWVLVLHYLYVSLPPVVFIFHEFVFDNNGEGGVISF